MPSYNQAYNIAIEIFLSIFIVALHYVRRDISDQPDW